MLALWATVLSILARIHTHWNKTTSVNENKILVKVIFLQKSEIYPSQQPIRHKPPHNNQDKSPGVGLISVMITF